MIAALPTRATLATCAAATLTLIALATAACSGGGDEQRVDVRVLAASSLTDVFEELSEDFMNSPEGRTANIELALAGSATLARQLTEGAPGSVVATANVQTMEVVRSRRITSEPRFFASNTLVLVTPADNPGNVTGPADLARRDLLLSVCNEQVPCGRLTIDAASELGLLLLPDSVETSVRGVLTKVELGEVDLGLVYATDVRNRDVLTFPLDLPADLVNLYPIATLDDSPEAAAFVNYVLSPAGKETLAEFGFGI